MANFVLEIHADELVTAIRELTAAIKGKQPEEPAAAPVEATTNSPDEPPAAPEKPVTLKQIQDALAEKMPDKKAAVKALIAKYGVKKLTDLEPDKYADFFKEAEAL